ncbi:MAG: hypothetical protein AAGD32_09215 [Planctomycetota bacterium]
MTPIPAGPADGGPIDPGGAGIDNAQAFRERTRQRLIHEEGLGHEAYGDTKGNATIGIGHHFNDRSHQTLEDVTGNPYTDYLPPLKRTTTEISFSMKTVTPFTTGVLTRNAPLHKTRSRSYSRVTCSFTSIVR